MHSMTFLFMCFVKQLSEHGCNLRSSEVKFFRKKIRKLIRSGYVKDKDFLLDAKHLKTLENKDLTPAEVAKCADYMDQVNIHTQQILLFANKIQTCKKLQNKNVFSFLGVIVFHF